MRLFLPFILSCLMLSACGSGGAENMNINANTTIGQELSDLKKAKDEGIISEKKYDNTKEDILGRYHQ